MTDSGLETDYSKLGIDIEQEKSQLARKVNLERLGNNPRKITTEQLEELLSS